MKQPKYVTAAEMRKIDHLAEKEYGIPTLLLMENAGAACARELVHWQKLTKGKVAVVCGKGNNGGDGFVAARHLHNHGLETVVFTFQPPFDMKPDAAVNFEILHSMGIRVVDFSVRFDPSRFVKELRESRAIVDAIFGIGLSKPVGGPYKEAIGFMNSSRRPILAVDIPSGLDSDKGEIMGAAVQAGVTVTLGLPKPAFLTATGKKLSGRVVVADISIPRELLS